MEHDQYPTAHNPHAPIQSPTACKRLVILQLDSKDRIIRHHRSGPIHKLDAESERNRATKSKLRRTWIRITLLPKQHELDADRLLVLLLHDLVFSPD